MANQSKGTNKATVRGRNSLYGWLGLTIARSVVYLGFQVWKVGSQKVA